MNSTVFSVNTWGSHPDKNNDDCWDGADFKTLEEAEADFAKAPAPDSHDIYVELAEGTRMGRDDARTIRVRKVSGRKGSYIAFLNTVTAPLAVLPFLAGWLAGEGGARLDVLLSAAAVVR